MRILTVAAAVSIAIFGWTVGVSSQSDRTVYGAGTSSCAEWTEARQGERWFGTGQWVLGFVSAVNQYSKETPTQTDARSMASRVDAYCRAHPEDDISDAARELVEYLLSGGQL